MMLNESLLWRYATKSFDANKKVSEDLFAQVMEAARLAPSSFGLELWKFVVVENPELRAKIREAAWNQGQVTDASHLVVLCRQADVNASDVEDLIARMTQTRELEDSSSLEGYKQMMLGMIEHMDGDKKANWMSKQVYLALGFLMAQASELAVDTCPMEGFDAAKVDEILGLADQNLRSVVLCPIGYRSEDDKYASLAKVRRSMEEVLVRIN